MTKGRVIDWLRKNYPQHSPWVYDPMGFRWLGGPQYSIEVFGESHSYDELAGTHVVKYVMIYHLQDDAKIELDILPRLEHCG